MMTQNRKRCRNIHEDDAELRRCEVEFVEGVLIAYSVMAGIVRSNAMNFTPFGVPFTGSLPVATQFAAAKFTQNITTANGQVVGVLSGGEGGVHYLRPVDGSGFATPAQNNAQQTVITLPITMPGAKPGDPQQTVQIQVVPAPPVTQNNTIQSPKYHISQIPIQTFQQGTTVLTVAYSPQGQTTDGVQLQVGEQQGIPEGMTVVAAIQPQDLQLIQAAQTQAPQQQQQQREDSDKTKEIMPVALIKSENLGKSDSNETEFAQPGTSNVTNVPAGWTSVTAAGVADYLGRIPTALPMSIHQFLKFSAETIKRESQVESSPLSADMGETSVESQSAEMETGGLIVADIVEQEPEQEDADKPKKKKKNKKKPPKPRRPKPGQVHIATALDGTTLFCCPECHMAYPEKELLEQHLVGHKIERRFICDICGAGLKRKEHLERHKLGHNPERPFVCSVCMKGFKRKEHLTLHYVIHSGEKNEVCEECGKGFYRKDHLRKHARSHLARRMKEEQQQQQQQQIQQQPTQTGQQQVTIQVEVPSANIQVPVQIQVPQHHIQVAANTGEDGHQVSTVVLPTAAETSSMNILPN
ncbi:lethal (3) neo38 [Carabus blaptoides fortunei]